MHTPRVFLNTSFRRQVPLKDIRVVVKFNHIWQPVKFNYIIWSLCAVTKYVYSPNMCTLSDYEECSVADLTNLILFAAKF